MSACITQPADYDRRLLWENDYQTTAVGLGLKYREMNEPWSFIDRKGLIAVYELEVYSSYHLVKVLSKGNVDAFYFTLGEVPFARVFDFRYSEDANIQIMNSEMFDQFMLIWGLVAPDHARALRAITVKAEVNGLSRIAQ